MTMMNARCVAKTENNQQVSYYRAAILPECRMDILDFGGTKISRLTYRAGGKYTELDEVLVFGIFVGNPTEADILAAGWKPVE